MKIKAKFDRNDYGEITFSAMINPAENYLRDLVAEAKCLIATAEGKKKICYQYDNIESKWRKKGSTFSGNAVHHEIYDVSADGRHCLMCVRESEGTAYGVRTCRKSYFILSAHGETGVSVRPASKGKAAKAAKQAAAPGDAIAVCLGKKKLKALNQRKMMGYKIVRKTDTNYVSVHDGSTWGIGELRKEGATPDHTGGFYIFETPEQAIKVWSESNVFLSDKIGENDNFELLECECRGRRYRHDNEKICIGSVRPVQVIASLIK